MYLAEMRTARGTERPAVLLIRDSCLRSEQRQEATDEDDRDRHVFETEGTDDSDDAW